MHPKAICLSLAMQLVLLARSRAALNAGKSIAASMAIIAITTKSSIKVNFFDSLFKVGAVHHHNMVAARAADFDIRAYACDGPFIAAAGMLFAHLYKVADGK